MQTEVGYMGDNEEQAHYDIVKYGTTAHKETLKVTYNADQISYEAILKYFFEIHDFSQEDGQGPDIGEQYKSVIFYQNETEHATAQAIINLLKKHKYHVATQLSPAMPFYRAEEYHQKYYAKHHASPYCHIHRNIFDKLS